MRSFRFQLLSLLLALSLVPLVTTVTWVLDEARDQAHTEALEELGAIAGIKQAALDSHLRSIEEEARALARGSSVRAVLEHVEAGGQASEHEAYGVAYEALHAYQESAWGRLHHVFLIDREGRVVLSPPHGDSEASHAGSFVEHPDIHLALRGSGVFTDFFGFSEKTHFHQLRLEPIKTEGGQVPGLLVVEVCIDRQNELLADGLEVGEDTHIYLTTLEGQRIVHDRSMLEPPLANEAIGQAIQHGQVFGKHEYEGATTTGVYLHHAEYPWVLAVEMDDGVIYAHLQSLTAVAIGITVSVAVVVGLIALLMVRRFTKPIHAVAARAREISDARLSRDKLEIKNSNTELGELAQSMNTLATSLFSIVSKVHLSADHVSQASARIGESSQGLDSSVRSQMDRVEGISGLLDEIRSRSAASYSSVDEMRGSASDAVRAAENGRTTVEGLKHSIANIESSSMRSAGVIQDIESIAMQTRLLALNAAVEAARAGDAGLGFGVVAEEVHELANRTATAASNTSVIIQESVDAARECSKTTSETTKLFERILNQIRPIQNLADEIAAASGQQGDAVSSVHDQVSVIAESTRATAKASERANKITGELETEVTALRELINEFDLE